MNNTNISVACNDSAQFVQTSAPYDSVSLVCGNGDGSTYCGNRTIEIFDKI